MFDLTGRTDMGQIALLVASVEQAAEVVALDVRGWGLAATHWPGPLTLVARASRSASSEIGALGRTVGVRMPDLDLLLDILQDTGPLAVTSANLTGGPPALSDLEARALFGEAVDLYVEGDCPGAVVSTVVDVTGTSAIVLRQGPVQIDS
jgi:tRNA threonylcarbamoyl adenosine modification protein (Sua5/YciO/YrdC/YwlC family)